MNDEFRRRVLAAAIALWWVVLFAAVLVTVSFLCYLEAMDKRPDWLLSLWGPGATWELINSVWFWAIVIVKGITWALVLLALWLTLWAKYLR